MLTLRREAGGCCCCDSIATDWFNKLSSNCLEMLFIDDDDDDMDEDDDDDDEDDGDDDDWVDETPLTAKFLLGKLLLSLLHKLSG